MDLLLLNTIAYVGPSVILKFSAAGSSFENNLSRLNVPLFCFLQVRQRDGLLQPRHRPDQVHAEQGPLNPADPNGIIGNWI